MKSPTAMTCKVAYMKICRPEFLFQITNKAGSWHLKNWPHCLRTKNDDEILIIPNNEIKMEFKSGQELLNILISDNYDDALEDWVLGKSKSGLSKKQIYSTLLLLFENIQKQPDPYDQLYNRLSEFLDRFTAFAKFDVNGNSRRILPTEPDLIR